MAGTYTLIASTVLTSAASPITFSSIPNTYQTLVIRGSLRSTAAASNTIATATFNGGTSGYSRTRGIEAYSNSSSSNRQTNASNMGLGAVNAGDNTANLFSIVRLIIPNYAGSDYKSGYWVCGMANNAGAAYLSHISIASTLTSAITSVSITDSGGGSWAIGSSLYLYGLSST